MIRESMWPPGDDVLIVICGPMVMCKVLKTLLGRLGYTVGNAPTDMVYSFM